MFWVFANQRPPQVAEPPRAAVYVKFADEVPRMRRYAEPFPSLSECCKWVLRPCAIPADAVAVCWEALNVHLPARVSIRVTAAFLSSS